MKGNVSITLGLFLARSDSQPYLVDLIGDVVVVKIRLAEGKVHHGVLNQSHAHNGHDACGRVL
jgi:hypothetical protein